MGFSAVNLLPFFIIGSPSSSALDCRCALAEQVRVTGPIARYGSPPAVETS